MTGRPPLHETRDANVVAILFVALALALLVGAAMILLRPLPHDPPRVELDERTPVLHWVETGRLLEERRALAEQRLGEWSWLDDQHTVAAIPIDEAMRLVVEEEPAP